MKKIRMIFTVFLLSSVLLVACSANDTNEESEEDASPEENEIDESTGNDTEANNTNETEADEPVSDDPEANGDADLDIDELSERIIDALHDRDMDVVAEHVHPEEGLLFSPYVYVMDDAVVFEKEEVASMLDDENAYEWGTYDGKGDTIRLTPEEYFDEFLIMDRYLEPDSILIDDLQHRGNTKNNLDEIYPDARIVEFYNEGSEEYAGMDWESILLVYKPGASGNEKLVAIVRDMWTI